MESAEMDHLTGMNLEVDADAGRHITNAGKWTKFIAIFMFIALGLGMMLLLAGSTMLERVLGSALPGFGRYSSMGTGIFVAIIVIVGAVFFYLFYLLYSFSQNAPAGVASEDKQLLNKGFQSLKLYFIISTSISILALLFTIYSLVFSGILR